MFTKAKFLLSAGSRAQFPDLKDSRGNAILEIAVVGRSNVGKSSLINHLTQNKNLAHVSSVPGKTKVINFFSINDSFFLVDLPGYGYAKVAKTVQERWSKLIEEYLENRPQLKLVLLLCDLRHPPTEDDIAFAEWAIHFNKPLMVVFTKADKVTQGGVDNLVEKYISLFNVEQMRSAVYSIKSGKLRSILINEIKKSL